MCDFEDFLFSEEWSEDLESDGEFDCTAILGETVTDGECESRESGETRIDGENIREIHFERIIGFFSDFPGDGWGGRSDDDIDFIEGFLEIFSDEFSYERCSTEVRIIESG